MKPSDMLKNELDVQDEDILAFADANFNVKKARKTKEAKFQFNPDFELKDQKLPNQARFLLKAIQESGETITYGEWGSLAADAGMGTKQDPARIAAYYRPLLVKIGAVTPVA